jgi:microcystin-dependent protein
MSDPFVAEIRMFAGNFAPTGWATCDGQLLPISQNTALFSLLGTFYGGDGKSTFALPDLQGRSPMHQGQGQGLSQRFLGEESGEETVTLLQTEMPLHTHASMGSSTLSNQQSPVANFWGGSSQNRHFVPFAQANTVAMNPLALGPTGGSLPHNNLQPYLVVTFIIAMQGVFPPRS